MRNHHPAYDPDAESFSSLDVLSPSQCFEEAQRYLRRADETWDEIDDDGGMRQNFLIETAKVYAMLAAIPPRNVGMVEDEVEDLRP